VKLLVVIFILGASIATAHAQYAPWCLQSDAFDGDRGCVTALRRTFGPRICRGLARSRAPSASQSSLPCQTQAWI